MRPVLSALLVALTLTATAPVLADNVSDAQAKFKAGATAYREARYKDAIDLFLQANRLDPHPELVFNVGQAYEKSGDVANGLRAYRDYLRLAPNADDRATVLASIKNLEQRLREKGVQQVSVFSNPSGARVFLDGVETGATPSTFETKPGRHVVVLKASGYPDTSKEFLLADDRSMDIDLTLSATPAASATTTAVGPTASATTTAPVPTITATPPKPDAPTGIAAVRPWTWAAFGVGVLGFGTAVGLEAARAGSESAAAAEPTQVGFKEKYDAMVSNQTGARIMAGIGAVGLAAGAVLLVVDLRSKSAPPSPSSKAAVSIPVLGLGCGPAACGLFAAGRL